MTVIRNIQLHGFVIQQFTDEKPYTMNAYQYLPVRTRQWAGIFFIWSRC